MCTNTELVDFSAAFVGKTCFAATGKWRNHLNLISALPFMPLKATISSASSADHLTLSLRVVAVMGVIVICRHGFFDLKPRRDIPHVTQLQVSIHLAHFVKISKNITINFIRNLFGHISHKMLESTNFLCFDTTSIF